VNKIRLRRATASADEAGRDYQHFQNVPTEHERRGQLGFFVSDWNAVSPNQQRNATVGHVKCRATACQFNELINPFQAGKVSAPVVQVLARSQIRDLAGRMSISSHHWFVQTDFGALLGPMPADALAEMARTGALLERDQVREASNGVWRTASDCPGFFEEAAQPLRQPDRLQEPASPRSSYKIASSARLLDDLMRSDHNDSSRRPVKPTAKHVAELDFEVDVPLFAPATVSKPPAVAASRAVEEFEMRSMPVVIPQPSSVDVAAPPPAPALATEPPPTDRIADWEPPAAVPVRRVPTTSRSSPRPSLWKRLRTVAALVAVVLVLVTGWWVWPRQRPDLYANYFAIYKELQQQRADSQDPTGWSEFSTRAKSQLEATIPWLEKRAKPSDREKSLLLYAGRDLQELLEQPRDSNSLHQKRLAAFFDQLQEIYGSK